MRKFLAPCPLYWNMPPGFGKNTLPLKTAIFGKTSAHHIPREGGKDTMSIRMSVGLSIYLSVCWATCVCFSVSCCSVFLSVCLLFCLPVCLSAYLTVYFWFVCLYFETVFFSLMGLRNIKLSVCLSLSV